VSYSMKIQCNILNIQCNVSYSAYKYSILLLYSINVNTMSVLQYYDDTIPIFIPSDILIHSILFYSIDQCIIQCWLNDIHLFYSDWPTIVSINWPFYHYNPIILTDTNANLWWLIQYFIILTYILFPFWSRVFWLTIVYRWPDHKLMCQ